MVTGTSENNDPTRVNCAGIRQRINQRRGAKGGEMAVPDTGL